MNERVRRLRDRSLASRPILSEERAVLLTEFYEAEQGKHSVPVMRAMAFRYLCEHKTVFIGEGELIVGGHFNVAMSNCLNEEETKEYHEIEGREGERIEWLIQHGVMPLYTPLGGSWLNMAESIQRILKRRAGGTASNKAR